MKKLLIVLSITIQYSSALDKVFKRSFKLLTPYEKTILKNHCYLANYQKRLAEYQAQTSELNFITYDQFKKTNLGTAIHSLNRMANNDQSVYDLIYKKMTKDKWESWLNRLRKK